MVVKVHGIIFSLCTQRVVTVLRELGVPYEIVFVDVPAKENRSTKYLETMQPFGQIPVLEDEDGFMLFESRAIARYLIAKHGPDSTLVPKGLQENARFEQVASIEAFNFEPDALGVLTEKVFKPIRGEQGDEGIAESYRKALEIRLEGYERILSKQRYLAGEELTLADLFHLPSGNQLTNVVKYDSLTKLPAVKRWWEDISSRESWKSVQADVAELMAKYQIQ